MVPGEQDRLGTMNFGLHTTQEQSSRSWTGLWNLNINFFDTADIDGRGGEEGDTEEILVAGLPRRRPPDAVVLATKRFFQPVKRKANLPEPNTERPAAFSG